MAVPPCPRFARCVLHGLALLILCLASCSDDPCESDKSEVESCNRTFRVDICATDQGRCAVHCWAGLSCEQFDELDQGKPPPVWLSRCDAKCQERLTCDGGEDVPAHWKCDGSRDCVDGTDEKGCRYFECANRQLVREDALCDEYADCQDGSDEEQCSGYCTNYNGMESCQ